MTPRTVLATAFALTLASGAVFAQEGAAPTLRVDSGNVMTSQGGEFVTAASGTPLEPGTRVMLAENAAATLVYANGCTRPLTDAGVFAVPPTCVAVAGGTGMATAVDVQGALILAGGTALVAAGLASMDREDAPPPISR